MQHFLHISNEQERLAHEVPQLAHFTFLCFFVIVGVEGKIVRVTCVTKYAQKTWEGGYKNSLKPLGFGHPEFLYPRGV